MEKPNCPGYVVLARNPGGNAYCQAIVELSFSMDLSPDRCLFFWSSKNATSNFGGKFEVDGLKDATHHRDAFAKNHPDLEFEIFDVHAEDLPIEIDWDGWRKSCTPAQTLSGVADKYGARNPRFKMKD